MSHGGSHEFKSGNPDELPRRSRWRLSLSNQILLGLVLGIGAGLFFGERCGGLSVIGEAFIGLLRMTVLPYIGVSLIANLGRLSLAKSGRLAVVGGTVLAGLWSLGLLIIFVMSRSYPQWKTGSFFSSAITDPPPADDLLSIFIPTNVFAAFADDRVAAVVVACILLGVGLAKVGQRDQLLTILDVVAKTLIRVSHMIARLTPVGVFAMTASAAGTMPLDDVPRLQAYFLSYTAGAVVLSVFLLPLLVCLVTPFSYRSIFNAALAPMTAAFATGKLIIVLPMLIENTEKLFDQLDDDPDGTAPTVDVLYPLAYPFPHVGKLLGLLFIPFAAWFVGRALSWDDYPGFLATGLVAYFSGPLLATPYLLDQMQLPHDMFQLFLVSGVFAERLGDATGAMHLLSFSVITTCVLTGRSTFTVASLGKFTIAAIVIVSGATIGLRAVLSNTLSLTEDRVAVINRMQLIEHPVESTILTRPGPNPKPLQPGETTLQRVRRRGIIRVGFNENELPFAFFNSSRDLVGFDINMAYALADDLGVRIEFVPFDRETLAQQLAADNFDVVMSGLVGTLERAETMMHTSSYMDVRLSLVVPDYRAGEFRTLASMRAREDLRFGFVDLSLGFMEGLRRDLPQVELVELANHRMYFDRPSLDLDALLISAESGSAFTLLYPEYEVVIPDRIEVSMPLFYAVGQRDAEMRDFLEHWIGLRKLDGTVKDFYDHWILGRTATGPRPRWCIARDVLGWVD